MVTCTIPHTSHFIVTNMVLDISFHYCVKYRCSFMLFSCLNIIFSATSCSLGYNSACKLIRLAGALHEYIKNLGSSVADFLAQRDKFMNCCRVNTFNLFSGIISLIIPSATFLVLSYREERLFLQFA